MGEQRRGQRFNPRAVHLAGKREPVIPPRLGDGKTAVIRRENIRIEEEGIEAAPARCRLVIGAEVDPPTEQERPVQGRAEIGDKIGISDDLAVRVDDAGKADAASANCGEDGADARLSVIRQRGEFDAKIEFPEPFGLLRSIDGDCVETGRAP